MNVASRPISTVRPCVRGSARCSYRSSRVQDLQCRILIAGNIRIQDKGRRLPDVAPAARVACCGRLPWEGSVRGASGIMAIHGSLLSVGGSFLAAMMLCSRAAHAADIQKIRPHLQRVYRDDFIEIRSDVAVPNAVALAARMKEAYRFDQQAQGFTSARFRERYSVGLASMPFSGTYGYGEAGGAALGPDTFVSHVDGYPFDKEGKVAWDGGTLSTTAHEFEHSLVIRTRC